MKPILEVQDLHKSFGQFHALKGISFTVNPGEIISVLGPSGCGKSTLLQIIAGLQNPDAGIIRLRGETVSTVSRSLPPEKRNINMVFQDYALWPHMNVYENIAYGLRRQKASEADIQQRISELLALLHLTGLEKRLPSQLSGGQQQRVAIARSLATRPDLLLLDEPLSNLDMRLRIEMRTEMAYLFRKLGTTVFHVTHDPEEAFAMADRLIIMRSGEIDQMDRPQVCFSRPATPSAASLLGAGNHLTGESISIDGQTAVRINDLTIFGIMQNSANSVATNSLDLLFRPDDVIWIDESNEFTVHKEISASLEEKLVYDRASILHGKERMNNRLRVQIMLSAFEGSRYRILAETLDGQQLSFLHHHALESGLNGWVWLPETASFLYPHEDER